MEPSDVEDAVRGWLDEHSVNPATGAPPDARVAVRVLRITPFGLPGAEEWSVTATLFFPEEHEDDLRAKITRVLQHLREALADPAAAAGAAVDLVTLEWRGAAADPVAHPDAPAGYPSSVDLLLTARPLGNTTQI